MLRRHMIAVDWEGGIEVLPCSLLKQRAVIEIPFPHETADRHKTGTLVRYCRRQPIHVPPNALPGQIEY